MTLTFMMKRMNMVVSPWCLKRGEVVAGLWEGSPCEGEGPAVETAGLTECPLAEGDGDPCLPPAGIMMRWAPAEVLLLRLTRVGWAGGVAVDATCPWDTHTEEGKIWTSIKYSLLHFSLSLSCFLFFYLCTNQSQGVATTLSLLVFVFFPITSLALLWACCLCLKQNLKMFV